MTEENSNAVGPAFMRRRDQYTQAVKKAAEIQIHAEFVRDVEQAMDGAVEDIKRAQKIRDEKLNGL